MGRGFDWSMRAELEEIVGYGDRVLVVTHLPGTGARRVFKTGDRNFHVLTVRNGRITALRACRDREQAVTVATAQ
jgi:ketosteroid isomerase-like protein